MRQRHQHADIGLLLIGSRIAVTAPRAVAEWAFERFGPNVLARSAQFYLPDHRPRSSELSFDLDPATPPWLRNVWRCLASGRSPSLMPVVRQSTRCRHIWQSTSEGPPMRRAAARQRTVSCSVTAFKAASDGPKTELHASAPAERFNRLTSPYRGSVDVGRDLRPAPVCCAYLAQSSPSWLLSSSADFNRAACSGAESDAPAVAYAPIAVRRSANSLILSARSVGVAGSSWSRR